MKFFVRIKHRCSFKSNIKLPFVGNMAAVNVSPHNQAFISISSIFATTVDDLILTLHKGLNVSWPSNDITVCLKYMTTVLFYNVANLLCTSTDTS